MIAGFPGLTPQNCRDTSPATPEYNCIAWAAGETDRWWWPRSGLGYWPAGVPCVETVQSFVAAFATLGFSYCKGPELEDGMEKVALYADTSGKPTHMARQLPTGLWTSKLGRDKDIEHQDPAALNGPIYGRAGIFLARKRRA